MSGTIIKTGIRNIPYFILVGLVYMKSEWMILECALFYIITIMMECRLKGYDDLEAHHTIDLLIELDEKLRIGDSPGFAYRELIKKYDLESIIFEKEIAGLSRYAWMLEEHLKKELDFDYEVFHRVLHLLMEEQQWKSKIMTLLNRSWIQLEIMKFLPLVIELTMAKNMSFEIKIYSLSLILLILANGISYMMYRELGV
jgi:hypothetical protein